MAWWGIAHANGPFYNRPWIRFTAPEIAETLPVCHAAARAALAHAEGCTPAERGLIEAVGRRYPAATARDHGVLDGWHRAFTDTMRQVHRAHPDDMDITALFAEAAVTCTPESSG